MRLADLIASLESWYDPRWAEARDQVGLVCGDPAADVRRILFAVDPVRAVVDEAVDFGADLVVVHHPLFLTPVSSVAATTAKGSVVHRLLAHGTALFTAHTNADVPPDGVNEALAAALGLQDPRVLLATEPVGTDKLVVFVPEPAVEAVRAAVTAAGAGALGAYDSCTFTTVGEGRFRPLDGANPAIGEVGSVEVVDAETRRLADAGLATLPESGTCCYAEQDKFWVEGTPDGERWEVYTVLADSPSFTESTASDETCASTDVTPGEARTALDPIEHGLS